MWFHIRLECFSPNLSPCGVCNLFLWFFVSLCFHFIPFHNWCADLRFMCTCCQRSQIHNIQHLTKYGPKNKRRKNALNDQQNMHAQQTWESNCLVAVVVVIGKIYECAMRCVREIFYKLEAFWKWHNSCWLLSRFRWITYLVGSGGIHKLSGQNVEMLQQLDWILLFQHVHKTARKMIQHVIFIFFCTRKMMKLSNTILRPKSKVFPNTKLH